MEPAIFFACPPSFDELCSITVSTERMNISAWPNATIQAHIVKCREVIFTEPNVIGSPSCYSDNSFSVIMKQCFFKTGKLQSRLQKQGIQISKPYRVDFPLYQSCLKYTLIARLAPTWNKAGEWFIQGRDFLVHNGYSNAIKMDLCVNKDELFVSLTGTAIRFPPLQIEDLNLNKQEMLNILKATEGETKETDVAGCCCHVLPSMNRGRISSVSLTIPRSSPFSSYKDLKRHWKNSYGYRLPETDEDVLYCQVGFLTSSCGKQFTYPNICLRSGPLQVIPRVDPKPILTIFLQDIHSRMTSVCGTPLRFQPKIRFAAPSLHQAGQTFVKAGISLASKPLNKVNGNFRNVNNIVLANRGFERDNKTMQEILGGNKNFPLESTRDQTTILLNDIREKQEKSFSQGHEKIDAKLSQMMQDAAIKVTQAVIDKATNVSTARSDVVGNIVQAAEIIDGNVKQAEQNINYTDDTQFICHSVSKAKDKEKSPERSNISFHKVGLKTNYNFTQDKEETSKIKFVPIFRTRSKQSSFQKCPTSSINSREKENSVSSSFIPSFKPKVIHNSNVNDKRPSHISLSMQLTSASNGDNLISKSPLFMKSNKQPPVHLASAYSKNNDHSIVQILPKSVAQKYNKNRVQIITNDGVCPINVTKSKEQIIPDLTKYRSDNCTPKSSSVSKRKNGLEGNTTPKKPRPKPQVHCLDVESLARANQLSKVNAVTLVVWLKERGVICKSKDKKPDLIDRTKKYLNIVDKQP